MYLVAVVWIYVASMMALAEATSTTGTVLGAVFTFVAYGLGPVSLVMYLLGTPARRRARKAAEALALARAEDDASSSAPVTQPDGGRHAPGHPVAAERKEP